MRMLKMDFLWTPTVSDHVLRHFNDLGVCVINPRDAARIEPHMCGLNCCRCCHTPENYRAASAQTRKQNDTDFTDEHGFLKSNL